MIKKIVKTTAITGLMMMGLSMTGLASNTLAQDRFANVKIKTTEVVPGIYMLEGAGGNIGLSTGDDGAFIIDDQFAPLSDKIMKAINEVSKNDLSFLLNTHWHGDHAGGNENFANKGATIVAHDNVRKRLKEGRSGENAIDPAPKGALPVITFSDTISFHWNGHDISIFHPDPAHTDGDSIVKFDDVNVIHMGDVYFKGSYPFIDLSSGGDLDGFIKATAQALAITDANTKIIPGHGALAGQSDLQETYFMLLEVRTIIANEIAAGTTEEEILAKAPLKKISEKWGKGFIKDDFMTRTAYRSLTAKK